MSEGNRQSGLSAIDIVVTIVFVALVLAMAVPAVDSTSSGSRDAKRLLGTIERLEDGCARHFADTKRVALELAPPELGHRFNQARYHHLSRKQTYAGWDGPYLEHPVTMLDNPFGAKVQLLTSLGDAPANGFSVGGEELDGRGQYVVFDGVPREVAETIDRHIDGESSDDWANRGRVEFDGGELCVMLMSVAR